MQDASTHPPHEHEHKHRSRFMTLLGAGTILAAGAVVLSPYVLPAIGLGTAELAAESLLALHGSGFGNGLAGFVSQGLNAIPFVGEALAKGGYAAALGSAGIGIGGVLLGQFLEDKKDGSKGVNWGKVITVGALATSALIALPSVLTSLSVGITFLCGVIGGNLLASSAATVMANTLGSMGVLETVGGDIAAGLAVMVPHLIACGTSLLPAIVSYSNEKREKKQEQQRQQHSHAEAQRSPAADIPQKYSDGTIQASIACYAPTAANTPCRATLTLKDKVTGRPITPDDLAEVHTKKLHLFVTDSSLKDYKHIHPEPLDVPGKYSFEFTPANNNPYTVWADLTKSSDGKNHQLKLALPASINRPIKPSIRQNHIAEADGLIAEWKSAAPLKAHSPTTVDVVIRDAQGKPVTDLQPVMGAFAHLVGFSSDGNSLIHAHPMGKEPANETERGGPRLTFHLNPDQDGKTQFYLQVKRDGKDIYAPFGQEISRQVTETGRDFSTRLLHSHAGAQPSL